MFSSFFLCFASVSVVFGPMLREFHLNIAKVDRGVAHIVMGPTRRIRLLLCAGAWDRQTHLRRDIHLRGM
jgi:hypothetical protein